MESSSSPSSGSASAEDRLMHALRRVLLEEALSFDAVGRAHQAERPVDDERLHARPDLFVVVQHILLADAWLPATAVSRHCSASRMCLAGFLRAGRSWQRGTCSTFFAARRQSSARTPVSATTSLAGLSSRSPWKDAWRSIPSLVQAAELDLRNQLRLAPRPPFSPRPAAPRRRLRRFSDRAVSSARRVTCGKAGADLTGIVQFALLMIGLARANAVPGRRRSRAHSRR